MDSEMRKDVINNKRKTTIEIQNSISYGKVNQMEYLIVF